MNSLTIAVLLSTASFASMEAPKNRDFQETLAKFSSWLTWGEDECDVLDVGCGSGDVTRDVLRPSLQCNKPTIVGVDVSQDMVNWAKLQQTIAEYNEAIAEYNDRPIVTIEEAMGGKQQLYLEFNVIATCFAEQSSQLQAYVDPSDEYKAMMQSTLSQIEQFQVAMTKAFMDKMYQIKDSLKLDKFNVQFKVLDIATSDNVRDEFPNGFDKIYSNYCLHLIKDQKRAMENIYALLKPGGEMVLSFLASNPLFQAYLDLASTSTWSAELEDYIPPYHNSEHPENQLRDLLETIGFTVQICECNEKSYQFENSQEIKDFVSTSFKTKIGSQKMREEFLNTVTDDLVSRLEKQPDDSYVMNYTLIQVLARKPL